VPPAKTLYLVDHQRALTTLLAGLLSSHELRVEIRSDGEELLANLDVDTAACVFVEMHAPGMSAAEIRTQLGLRGVAIPVIQIDGRMAVEQGGAATAADEPARSGGGRGSVPLAGPDAFPTLEVLRERYARLTSRQREVARLVAQGYSSKELARVLKLSKNTVDNHRTRILEKLELGNFVQVGRFLALLPAEEQDPSASRSTRSSRRM
jgi:FixJ family two-component response regulator